MSTRTFAAGLSTRQWERMVAPSLVTMILFCLLGPAPKGFRILSIPLGPIVVFTRSAREYAPKNEFILASDPFYS